MHKIPKRMLPKIRCWISEEKEMYLQGFSEKGNMRAPKISTSKKVAVPIIRVQLLTERISCFFKKWEFATANHVHAANPTRPKKIPRRYKDRWEIEGSNP